MAIHLLEQEGIDVNNFDEDGRAALHYAACHDKNSECLDVFLAQSDVTRREVNKWNKVDCCFGGRTPLWMAVSVNAVGASSCSSMTIVLTPTSKMREEQALHH